VVAAAAATAVAAAAATKRPGQAPLQSILGCKSALLVATGKTSTAQRSTRTFRQTSLLPVSTVEANARYKQQNLRDNEVKGVEWSGV
jgi:hypothetical protein